MNAIMSPQDASELNKFEERRKKLMEICTQAKSVKTPKEHLEEVGKYFTPSFEYMESQMDQFHPRRAIQVVGEGFSESAAVFWFTVEVTDLETGEKRAGTGLHAAIIYEKGTEIRKSEKEIRELLSNAKKAALTEAIRDAYAHFGIAADLYGMKAKEYPNEKQKQKFNELLAQVPIDKQAKIREAWSTQLEQTADEFLSSIERGLQILKEQKKEDKNEN